MGADPLAEARRRMEEYRGGTEGGDYYGHPFHGNQYTGGISGPISALGDVSRHASRDGFTFHRVNDSVPAKPLTASVAPQDATYAQTDDIDVADFRQFMDAEEPLLQDEQQYFAVFHDPMRDEILFDVHRICKTPAEAQALARRYNMGAYFDADTGQAFDSNGRPIIEARVVPDPPKRFRRRAPLGPVANSQAAESSQRTFRNTPTYPTGGRATLDPLARARARMGEWRYAPDQVRDEHGRWTAGMSEVDIGKVEAEVTDSPVKNGLLPSLGKLFEGRRGGQGWLLPDGKVFPLRYDDGNPAGQWHMALMQQSPTLRDAFENQRNMYGPAKPGEIRDPFEYMRSLGYVRVAGQDSFDTGRVNKLQVAAIEEHILGRGGHTYDYFFEIHRGPLDADGHPNSMSVQFQADDVREKGLTRAVRDAAIGALKTWSPITKPSREELLAGMDPIFRDAQEVRYSPDQDRDQDGRFTSGGIGSAKVPLDATGHVSFNPHTYDEDTWPGHAGPRLLSDGSDMPERVQAAWQNYLTEHGSRSYNDCLRSGGKECGQMGFSGEKDHGMLGTNELDAAISKYRLEQDAVLYRGIATNRDFPVGTRFTDKAYASTTWNIDVAVDFARLRATGEAKFLNYGRAYGGKPVVLELRVPKGTHALPGDATVSELILPRGLTFEVTGHDSEGHVQAKLV